MFRLKTVDSPEWNSKRVPFSQTEAPGAGAGPLHALRARGRLRELRGGAVWSGSPDSLKTPSSCGIPIGPS